MKIKRKQIKYGLIGMLFVGLIGAGTIIYLFNMPHRDVLSEEAGLQVNAQQLVDEFLSDETTANRKYLDKVIIVSGPIAHIDTDMNNQSVYILKELNQTAGVRSTFTASSNPEPGKYAVGDRIEIKGIVRAGAAYLADLDLVEHVILEKSIIIE